MNPFLSLGMMPLTGSYPKLKDEPVEQYPLNLSFCQECFLVQICEKVPVEWLFARGYAYHSSYSTTMLEHARRYANKLVNRLGLDHGSLVIEIGSNDGYMLKNFLDRGINVLGIDPAREPASVAHGHGIETLTCFFDRHCARRLKASGNEADVIIANNVLAHAEDPTGFLEGALLLLKPNGLVVIEVPYLRELVDRMEFDTIYHEHRCYFSLTALVHLFERAGLSLFDVEQHEIHGGSLRLFACRPGVYAVTDAVRNLLETERHSGMHSVEYYREFSRRVQHARESIHSFLGGLYRQGASIAAYGAAAKGVILLNACAIGSDILDFVVDRNPGKQDRYMPGTGIPVLRPEAILQAMPDYVIVLPWNLTDEILEQECVYSNRGGRFIVPLPTPRIIS
ncbi:MAG: class I SAM-dependent methyltransferase [Gammaproteobacteria bacterium]|nr:class I SAM-dependent methyltransferase [Gammaproteobacteria bacterium]